jgi:hypothetical protein
MLADRIGEDPRRRTGLPCSVAELEESLDGKEADALHAMLYTLGWSQEKIYAALRDEGHSVGKQTINRHRSRSCRCFQ